jgi:hypothetical protein
MMNGPFGQLERVAHLRPRITHLAAIPQLAPVGSIPNLPRPSVFGKRECPGCFNPVIENCEPNFRKGSMPLIKPTRRGVRLTFWCFEGRFCPWLLTAAPRRGSCETLEATWTLMLTRHTQPPCRAVDARRGLRAS